jgi:hypothetical protein
MEKYFIITNVAGHDNIGYTLVVDMIDTGIRYRLLDHPTNEERMVVIDTGNGLILQKKFKKLDYTEQYELSLILEFMNKPRSIRRKHRFVKDVAL